MFNTVYPTSARVLFEGFVKTYRDMAEKAFLPGGNLAHLINAKKAADVHYYTNKAVYPILDKWIRGYYPRLKYWQWRREPKYLAELGEDRGLREQDIAVIRRSLYHILDQHKIRASAPFRVSYRIGEIAATAIAEARKGLANQPQTEKEALTRPYVSNVLAVAVLHVLQYLIGTGGPNNLGALDCDVWSSASTLEGLPGPGDATWSVWATAARQAIDLLIGEMVRYWVRPGVDRITMSCPATLGVAGEYFLAVAFADHDTLERELPRVGGDTFPLPQFLRAGWEIEEIDESAPGEGKFTVEAMEETRQLLYWHALSAAEMAAEAAEEGSHDCPLSAQPFRPPAQPPSAVPAPVRSGAGRAGQPGCE